MSMAGDPLFVVLQGSRTRLLARAALMVPLAAGAAAAGVGMVLVALEGARRLDWLALSEPLPLVTWSLGAAGVGGALAAFAAARAGRTLDWGPLALRIDRASRMGLVYATAVEIAGRNDAGPVASALLSEARRKAAALDYRRLFPLATKSLRQTFIAVLVTAGLAIGLYQALPPLTLAAPPPVEAAVDDIRADAQELADRLNREAVLGQDPTLAAIARAIEERVVQAQAETPAQALASELDALIEQARAAMGERAPSWLDQRPRSGAAPETGAMPNAGTGPGNNQLPVQGDDVFAISLEDIESARRAQENFVEPRGLVRGAEAPASGDSTPGDNEPAGAGMPPQKIDPEQLQAAGRESVGAAAESGRGPADQAGGGTAGLDGEAMSADAEGQADMALPQAAQDTGRRIRIALPPAEGEAAAPSGQAGTAAGSQGLRTVDRPLVPAGSRALIGRYFERTAP